MQEAEWVTEILCKFWRSC